MWLGQPNGSDEPRRASVSSRADGSIALLDGSSTTRLGPTLRTLGCCLHESPTGFTFVLADGRGDSIDIEVVGLTDSLSELVEILDDCVPALHDGFLAGSSSGVWSGVEPGPDAHFSTIAQEHAFVIEP